MCAGRLLGNRMSGDLWPASLRWYGRRRDTISVASLTVLTQFSRAHFPASGGSTAGGMGSMVTGTTQRALRQ